MLIGVVGAGTMGSGIAQSFASNGFKVLLYDMSDNILSKGIDSIDKSLNRMVNKKRFTSDLASEYIQNIKTTTDMNVLIDCDLIIEAATENINIKKKIFQDLDTMVKDSCILASNTSSISINELADSTNRADKIIGMHFMNPVPIMKLVEVIQIKRTSNDTLKLILDLSSQLNKIPVTCLDSPGFISNRILMPMINEAIYSLMEGVATKEAIDEIMVLGMSHPMGPLKLADLIGLDVCLSILNVLKEGFNGNSKYEPCPLLVQKCNEGKLGRKTGEGFYRY